MPKYVVTDDFVIENSLDGKRQILHAIDDESETYQAIKAETNNFTNLDFPPIILLADTDAGMARVAEDIFDMLIAEGKIFPQSVIDKIAERKALRSTL